MIEHMLYMDVTPLHFAESFRLRVAADRKKVRDLPPGHGRPDATDCIWSNLEKFLHFSDAPFLNDHLVYVAGIIGQVGQGGKIFFIGADTGGVEQSNEKGKLSGRKDDRPGIIIRAINISGFFSCEAITSLC